MQYREVHAYLRRNGFTPRHGKGRHQVWRRGGAVLVTLSDPHKSIKPLWWHLIEKKVTCHA